jgi:hypothetical protein
MVVRPGCKPLDPGPPLVAKPRRGGRGLCRPAGALLGGHAVQGLTPLANDRRPSGLGRAIPPTGAFPE